MTFGSAVNPLYSIPVILIALLLAHVLADRGVALPVDHGRYESLDGLRGFAALFVFIHHAAIWYYYATTHVWTVPPSNLYTQYGEGAVTMFFLLTSFLFWTKLAKTDTPVSWVQFYSSRICRIAPLYFVSMLLLAAVALWVSHGAAFWTRGTGDALLRIAAFTPGGVPNLFGVHDTFVINAGVTWTLPYEWWFYLALPVLLSMVIRGDQHYGILLTALLLLVLARDAPLSVHMLGIFAFGILTSVLLSSGAATPIQKALSGWLGSVLIVMSSAVIVLRYGSAYAFGPLALYFLIFLIIAAGNTLFGLLTSTAARKLGQVSYSVYLLQGFVLYGAFTWLLGHGTPAIQSPLAHWLLAYACVSVLVLISVVSYLIIEKPMIARARPFSRWLQKVLS